MNKAELLDLGEGHNLEIFKGIVVSTYPVKDGGKWSVQNGMLKLASGEQVAIAFWNRDDIAHLKNKSLTFHGKETKGGTIKLGRVKGGSKEGNLQIDIGEDVTIEQGNTQSASPSPSTRTASPKAANGNATVDDVLAFYNKVYGKVIDSSPEEERTDRDHMRGITACVFIECQKRGITE